MYHLADDDCRAHVEKASLRSTARSRQPLEVRRSMAHSRKAQRKSRRRHDSDGDGVEAEGDGMDKGPGALNSNSVTNSSSRNNGNDDDAAALPAEPFGKWSTHFDKTVTFAVRGTTVALAQDPASDNIGHSVWDVSRAVARFLELDPWWRRELARHRRVVELGAGCGLVGIAAAMLGGHVTLTDLPSVIPLLARNVHAAMTSAGVRALNGVGTATAADLTWRDSWFDVAPPDAVGLPDLIIGTDIVYFAELVEPLVQTLVALAGPATVILIANERRIPRVHALFSERASLYFRTRPVRLDIVGAEIDTSAFETWELRRLPS